MSIKIEMRCPGCHHLMEEGCLPTGGGMHWYRRHVPLNALAAEPIPGTATWLRRSRLPAWRCRGCHLILFRYGDGAAADLPDDGDQNAELEVRNAD